MPIQSCGQSVSAQRGKRYTEIGLLKRGPSRSAAPIGLGFRVQGLGFSPPIRRMRFLPSFCFSSNFFFRLMSPPYRGLHSFALELNLINSRTHSWVELGYAVDGRAQVELKWERV